MSDNQKWFRSVHLDDSIVKALELLGIHQPTEVQERFLSPMLLYMFSIQKGLKVQTYLSFIRETQRSSLI